MMSRALTPKQELFVQALVSGKSQREAYRSAYDAERMSDRTVANKASLLLGQGKIKARYDELVAEVARAAQWDRLRAAHELLAVLETARLHIEATMGDAESYTDTGRRQLADIPASASRAFLDAIIELNKMFNVYGESGSALGVIVIMDDIGQPRARGDSP